VWEVRRLAGDGRGQREGEGERERERERDRERKNFLSVGTLACHHPRSVINTVVVRLRRQWVESSRDGSARPRPRGYRGERQVALAGQAPPRGKPVCVDDAPILTDAKGLAAAGSGTRKELFVFERTI